MIAMLLDGGQFVRRKLLLGGNSVVIGKLPALGAGLFTSLASDTLRAVVENPGRHWAPLAVCNCLAAGSASQEHLAAEFTPCAGAEVAGQVLGGSAAIGRGGAGERRL